MNRVYLDNAATSWPKPEAVYRAVERYQRELGAAVGRGSYAEAMEVASLVAAARCNVARLIGASDSRHVIFTGNGTDSLNLAIHGLLDAHSPADSHAVTTVLEHNSVLRPLRTLEHAKRLEVTRVLCQSNGVVDPDAIRGAIRSNTKLVVVTQASNVTGVLQPVKEIGRICRQAGVPLLVDAAQALGETPIDVESLGADLLAAPGHKGLLGPLGTGILYIRPGLERSLASVRQGGTGTVSEQDRQPESLPDKYESGNLNAPGIMGLGAGVAYLLERSVESVRRHAIELTERLLAGLVPLDGVVLHGPANAASRVGLVSVTVAGYDPQELAASLDAGWRVQVRAGLHCAPDVHRVLGTLTTGGTLRFSPGPFTTTSEIDTAVSALGELAATAV